MLWNGLPLGVRLWYSLRSFGSGREKWRRRKERHNRISSILCVWAPFDRSNLHFDVCLWFAFVAFDLAFTHQSARRAARWRNLGHTCVRLSRLGAVLLEIYVMSVCDNINQSMCCQHLDLDPSFSPSSVLRTEDPKTAEDDSLRGHSDLKTTHLKEHHRRTNPHE